MTNKLRFLVVIGIGLGCFVVWNGMASDRAADRTIDFDTEVMPVFSRMGCNAGACHGAAVGRGGFRLSLFGADPAGDFENIVHELEGRRINLVNPDDSLIVQKPTTQIEHGGGYRFSVDDEAGKRLMQWVAAGAKRSKEPRRLVTCEVSPMDFVATKAGKSAAFKAIARYSDGQVADVTDWTIWQSNDPASVEVVNGQAKLLRPGQHVVIARYLDRVVPIRLSLPFANPALQDTTAVSRNFVDQHIDATLQQLRLPASDPCDNATYLRRLRLDLTGRLPTLAEVENFGADGGQDQRVQLINRLLAGDDFVEYWTFQLALWLRNRPLPNEQNGAVALHHWLGDQLKSRRGMNDVVKDLLMARGDSHKYGPAWFWRLKSDARSQAELIGQAFLGVHLQCANCHNHPLDRWIQDDYHGLAAMLSKVERGRQITIGPRGEVIHPRTGEPALLRFPGVGPTDALGDPREPLADWLVRKDNPFFAKAIVNRLWKAMFGRGLVEPVDDMRDTNPATHPALLNQLAADFVKNNYDIRHTLRMIATSESYRRSRFGTPANRDDDRYYSHAFHRPLSAEVLADAWSEVTGVWDNYGDAPVGTRAIALVDPATPSRTLDLLGRCSRKETCDGSTMATGLPALLQRINGEAVNRKLTAGEGRLQRLIADSKSNDEIIAEFYLRALGRLPTVEEKKLLVQPVSMNRTAWLEDVAWALLNSREFTTNH